MNDVASVIRAAAAQYGLDPETMVRIAHIESRLDPRAANPRSSARGVFQFISPTWAQYGRGADPNDLHANVDAGMRFTVDNRNSLRSALGRDPTPGELYLAHQQGAGGAAKLLRDPSVPAESVVGRDAIVLNGGAPGMSAGDFAAKWTAKLGGEMPSAGSEVSAAPVDYAAAQGGVLPLDVAAVPRQTAQAGAPLKKRNLNIGQLFSDLAPSFQERMA